MYTWYKTDGTKLKTRTIKEFSAITQLRYSNCKSLACGHYQTLHEYISPAKSAKKRRERVLMKLLNTRTGEIVTLGKYITTFARKRSLSVGRLGRLIRKERLKYRDWVLLDTYQQALGLEPGLAI